MSNFDEWFKRATGNNAVADISKSVRRVVAAPGGQAKKKKEPIIVTHHGKPCLSTKKIMAEGAGGEWRLGE